MKRGSTGISNRKRKNGNNFIRFEDTSITTDAGGSSDNSEEDESKAFAKNKHLKDIKHPSFYTIWKESLAYLISDIKKKPRSFRIGVFTITLVCSFIVMLDSLMALAPLFSHNPMGDNDLSAVVRPPFGPPLVKGNRAAKVEGELDLVDSIVQASQRIKDNDLDSDSLYSGMYSGYSNNKKQTPQEIFQRFLDDPSSFITNVTRVEEILETSNRTKDLIHGVYGRFTLP